MDTATTNEKFKLWLGINGLSRIRFEVPFHTVVKKNNRSIGYNRRTGQRFSIKSKRLKDYEIRVMELLSSELELAKCRLPLLTGKVKAIYKFYFKRKSRADWDNLPAALQDCAQASGILANDQLAEFKIPLHELKLQYIYEVIKFFKGDRAKAARALKINLNFL